MPLLDLVLLAQDRVAQYNQGLRTFQSGLMLTGAGIIFCGFVMILSKEKPSVRHDARRILGISLLLGGAGIIAYAWMGFSPMTR